MPCSTRSTNETRISGARPKGRSPEDREMKSERTRGMGTGYWVATGVFALQMGFTAYAQLCLPQVARVFAHLGFPDYFRVELSLVKMAGLVVLLLPMAPARLKEWAYA